LEHRRAVAGGMSKRRWRVEGDGHGRLLTSGRRGAVGGGWLCVGGAGGKEISEEKILLHREKKR
jgi:hypothetical protein